MKQQIFKGAGTALITPMDDNGVNYQDFERLIEWQIQQGVDALIIGGTTGEGVTLSDEERKGIVQFAVKCVNHRIPVIAGTGTNNLAHGLELTKAACNNGADAVLVVTPYYNKTTQAGLVKLYNTYADTSTVPVILYNVPSRTGIGIEPATYEKLAEHPNIVAIKEANGDISKIAETRARVGDALDMYSGNDDQIVPILSLGGIGVISVLSNLLPRETHEMCHAYFDGNTKKAAELQLKYNDLVGALFCEVNPIPVKAAMAHMGFCKNFVRPPLYSMEPADEERLLASMRQVGIEV